MPNLLFQPTYERHLTVAAVYECPKKYEWLTKIRSGQRPAPSPSRALAIGIGMDAGVWELWANGWSVGPALEEAVRVLQTELVTPPSWDVPDTLRIVEHGVRQYAEQWNGIRQWEVLALHPYLDTAAWMAKVGVSGMAYLPMPDALFRIDGTITVVDLKTGRYAYDPNDWLTDPQMIINAAMVQRAWQEPVSYMVDYCQKPSESKSATASRTWTFPATMAMVLDDAKADLAWGWVRDGLDLIHHYETLRRTNDGVTAPHFPRALNACRGKYGLCEFYWEGCIGASDAR